MASRVHHFNKKNGVTYVYEARFTYGIKKKGFYSRKSIEHYTVRELSGKGTRSLRSLILARMEVFLPNLPKMHKEVARIFNIDLES